MDIYVYRGEPLSFVTLLAESEAEAQELLGNGSWVLVMQLPAPWAKESGILTKWSLL